MINVSNFHRKQALMFYGKQGEGIAGWGWNKDVLAGKHQNTSFRHKKVNKLQGRKLFDQH